jgi:hypothetical protein
MRYSLKLCSLTIKYIDFFILHNRSFSPATTLSQLIAQVASIKIEPEGFTFYLHLAAPHWTGKFRGSEPVEQHYEIDLQVSETSHLVIR